MLNKGMWHHATVIEEKVSTPEEAQAVIAARAGVPLSLHDPDVRFFLHDTFGISEVRALAHTATQKPSGARQWLIAAALTFTTEAQNALLKLLEDPPAASRFIIIIPRAATLLPTVRSRVALLRRPPQDVRPPDEGVHLLALERGEKLRYVAPLVKKGDKEGALALLDALEAALARYARDDEAARALLRQLPLLRTYLLGRAPSVKQILEYVAVTCPMVYP